MPPIEENEPIPQSEGELTGLGQKILKHWRQYRPNYVRSLEGKSALYPTVDQAATDHSEIFSEMRSQGFGVDQAMEAAREGWISPESDQNEPSDQNTSQAET